jgi:hypothetical protein
MTARRCSLWLGIVLGVGVVGAPAALGAETVTVTPPPDAISGTPFQLTVSTTSDVTSSSSLRVFVRRDDGRPCEATASAANASVPKPLELYDDRRRAAAVTVDVPGQDFVGGLRVCAFVELIPAPQTTLSTQDLVVGIRAPRGTLALSVQTGSPYYAKTFTARAQGSTEAPAGTVLIRAQRGPCGMLSGTDIAIGETPAGPYDVSQDITIDPTARVVPDRVCAWLYATAGGMLLATAEQPVKARYDGSLVPIGKRFIKLPRTPVSFGGWVVEIRARSTGKVDAMTFRVVRGGRCTSFLQRRTGAIFVTRCLLKNPPRRPFVVAVTYTTSLGVQRSASNVTITVPARRRPK